jgi:AGCS family alanine or glycine:cation symporter
LTELQWKATQTIRTGIGQGTTMVTPMAIARYVSTIANGGTVYDAHIVERILDAEGGLGAFASKGAAAASAFNTILPGTLGGKIIELSLLFFALSTILSWAYYGENCWGYLTKNNKTVMLIYKVIFALVCIVGATGSGTLMWDIADTLNGLMAIPNLIALLILSGVVAKTTKDYFSNHMLK